MLMSRLLTIIILRFNLLYSASQQKSYTAQSVTNAAVCAANVQVAANAVLRLSSDMGSIYSMLSAADFGSEIYLQSRTAYSIMNETAYDAEKSVAKRNGCFNSNGRSFCTQRWLMKLMLPIPQ